MFLLLFTLALVLCQQTCVEATPPHIIYILADDLGWNDVSFHGSDQIPTPNIDALAYHGVILNRHYTQPLCSPSRACLMTGKYAIHTGVQRAYAAGHKNGLPLEMKIMPEYLKSLGYKTHLVGKWHLGFFKKDYTPLQRGFDSHFGYYTGLMGYFDHTSVQEIGYDFPDPGWSLFSNYVGLDLRRDYTPAWDLYGQYATDLFTEEAVSLIASHPSDTPMFLYLAHLAVHAGNSGKLVEAPQEEEARFLYIRDPSRRTYAAMMSKLDDSVGQIIKALGEKDMLQNSIVVFASDNGAPNYYSRSRNWGSSYPFRGVKDTLWEGGVRNPALVWSPLINNPSRVTSELMHISDWLPTLLTAAGFDLESMPEDIDGVDQWQMISNGYQSPRDDLLLDIYNKVPSRGYILGPYKYIKGSSGSDGFSPEKDGYLNFNSIFSKDAPKYDLQRVTSSMAWSEIHKFTKNVKLRNEIPDLRQASTVTCAQEVTPALMSCDDDPCLFNIIEDPCEQVNIAKDLPGLISQIEAILKELEDGKYPEENLIIDLQSTPDRLNGTWSVWID